MRWNRIIQIILLGLGLTLLLPAIAESEAKDEPAPPAYRVTRFTSEDGLPSNRINALAQTRDGYLWVATWFGLARFDGLHFKVFNRYNTPALAEDAINALAEDNAGRLWIGTSGGLVVLRDGHFTRYTAADGLPGKKVWHLAASRSGGVWIDADRSISLWRDEKPLFRTDLPAPLRSIWENEDGTLTAWTESGIRIVDRTGEIVAQPAGPGALSGTDNISGYFVDRQHRRWLSRTSRLSRFSNGSWTDLQQTKGSGWHFLYEDRSGAVWVNRGQAGFWRFHADRADPIDLGHRAEEPSVDCMFEDREGHFWIGTPHGLYQLRPRLIRASSVADGLPDYECRSVSAAPDGAVWVETPRGLACIREGRVLTFPDEPERVPRASVLADRQGRIWMGNGYGGLISWRPGIETNFWRYREQATLEALYLDPSGRVWAGSNLGAAVFENGRQAADWGGFNLPTNAVCSIFQTHDGTMWFGTAQDGVVRWRGGIGDRARHPEVTRFTTAHGLADNRVFVFHEDAEGHLWIGTHHGLSLFKDGRFFTFRTGQGLFDNLINWLERDDFGRFWFSCNRGIFRIDRQELLLVAAGKKDRASSAIYGTTDGMLNPETNGEHQPAGCKDRDGRIWFPTMHGVVAIDPRQRDDSSLPPLAVIEEVRADGELVGGNLLLLPAPGSGVADSPLKLEPGRARILQFRYTGNSFADSKRVRFRYRLAGRESGWREETEERTAYYTDLQPGAYRFELEAASSHGVWTPSPVSFAFSLAPAFTQTFWFPLVWAAGLLAASGGFAAWRLRWQRRVLVAEQHARLEGERTRIARDLHDDLGTALTGLALEVDVIRRDAREMAPPAHRLTATAQRLRQLAGRMREVVWAVNPRCDTLSSLASFIEQQTAQFLQADGIRGRLEFPDEIPAWHVDSETRHQLILAVREALTNVVRHAAATQVVIKMTFGERMLVLQVADNGCGFDPKPEIGHGLRNIGQRVERIGGRFICQSGPGIGTTLTFRIPLDIPSDFHERAKP